MASMIFCLSLRRDTINSGGWGFFGEVSSVCDCKKETKEENLPALKILCCGVLVKPRKMWVVGLHCGLLAHLKHLLFINNCG